MHENIEMVKERFFLWFAKAAYWYFIANLFVYAAACTVANGLVGPVRYVEFLNHCAHWRFHG